MHPCKKDEEIGSDLSDEEDDLYAKYFPTKANRKSRIQKYKLSFENTAGYSHPAWLNLVAQRAEFKPTRGEVVYPPDSTDEVGRMAGMTEVANRTQLFNNTDLFDTEESDQPNSKVQPDQINMAVFFWYLVLSGFTTVY